jgi:hypothetical protein
MKSKGIKKRIVKYKKIIIGCLVLLFIFIGIYLINGKAGFSNVKMTGFKHKGKRENFNPLRNNKVVLTSIHIGAGDRDSLGLVLASPYKNIEQASQLSKYSTQIKNDFLLAVSEEKLKVWIKNRDFDGIRSTFRQIVNQYLDEPVPEVYISSYFYE